MVYSSARMRFDSAGGCGGTCKYKKTGVLGMRKKREFQIYTGMWLLAILILLALLWQNVGDARIINYSGIVRGATQKLVKEELAGEEDDALISYLDGVIYDLQTGKGDYHLTKNGSKDYQHQLAELKVVWEQMKSEIPLVRGGTTSAERLYAMSQQHFKMADRLVLCAEQNSDGKLTRFIVFYLFSLLLSITVFAIVNKRNQKQLEESISVDQLTGLQSRYGFETAAAEMLRQNPKTEYVIVEFDIDDFKMINDVCGYAQGDMLLHELAAAISRWQGEKRMCARINADDFVLLAQSSETVIGQLRDILKQAAGEQKYLESFGGVAFTFGAYRIEDNAELIKTIMDKANTAHKMAKVYDHKSLVWYDKQLLEKLRLESRYKEQMHHGLANGEFKLYLQPKVELSSMNIAGAEALVRWKLPENGIIPPDDFIPLFEKNGLIGELDFYMLEKACIYLREQLDRGASPFTISVNFSRVTLYQQMFYDTFIETVDRFDLPHGCIEVEVTESAFNKIADTVLQMLGRLKDSGFIISMDDFGAGYSNLNMLSKLPIHIIKLDREFLRELDSNRNMKGIVACAVEMAHALGVQVVCEGVEQSEHITFLQEIGCNFAQGYYFSRPIPQEDFTSRFPFF